MKFNREFADANPALNSISPAVSDQSLTSSNSYKSISADSPVGSHPAFVDSSHINPSISEIERLSPAFTDTQPDAIYCESRDQSFETCKDESLVSETDPEEQSVNQISTLLEDTVIVNKSHDSNTTIVHSSPCLNLEETLILPNSPEQKTNEEISVNGGLNSSKRNNLVRGQTFDVTLEEFLKSETEPVDRGSPDSVITVVNRTDEVEVKVEPEFAVKSDVTQDLENGTVVAEAQKLVKTENLNDTFTNSIADNSFESAIEDLQKSLNENFNYLGELQDIDDEPMEIDESLNETGGLNRTSTPTSELNRHSNILESGVSIANATIKDIANSSQKNLVELEQFVPISINRELIV